MCSRKRAAISVLTELRRSGKTGRNSLSAALARRTSRSTSSASCLEIGPEPKSSSIRTLLCACEQPEYRVSMKVRALSLTNWRRASSNRAHLDEYHGQLEEEGEAVEKEGLDDGACDV